MAFEDAVLAQRRGHSPREVASLTRAAQLHRRAAELHEQMAAFLGDRTASTAWGAGLVPRINV